MLLLSPFQRQFLVVAIKHVLKLIFQIWIAEISRKFCAKRFCDPNLDPNRLIDYIPSTLVSKVARSFIWSFIVWRVLPTVMAHRRHAACCYIERVATMWCDTPIYSNLVKQPFLRRQFTSLREHSLLCFSRHESDSSMYHLPWAFVRDNPTPW